MTDPFTSASPTYIAAQRTNQSKNQGWCFAPELDEIEPLWVRVIRLAVSALFNPASLIGLSLLGLMVWILMEYGS